MAINKNKNILIQITISKTDAEKLTAINEELNALLCFNLTKSQTIAFLIKNYNKNKNDKTNKPINQNKTNINYMAQVIALKDKLNVSYTRLSQIIGIPATTLKKYASGKQTPKNENENLLKMALAKYGIK